MKGVDGHRVLERGGVDASRFSDPYGWFTLEEFDALLLLALEITGDAALGLHWGEHSPMMQYDLLAPLIAQAESLQAAIATLLRFQPIMGDRPEMEFVDHGGSAVLRCSPLGLSEAGMRVRTEVALVGIARMLKYLGVASSPVIRKVSFVYARPAYGAEYDRLFGSVVRFKQSFSGIEFDYAVLDCPQPHRNAELHSMLSAQAERVLSRLVDEQTYAEQLKRLLQRAQPRVLEMPEAARSLGMSERSLRRRLADEGVSYTQLVEQSQIELARAMLVEPTRSIKQIAHELGFTSASGFHRAFKRWTGTSPALFRARR